MKLLITLLLFLPLSVNTPDDLKKITKIKLFIWGCNKHDHCGPTSYNEFWDKEHLSKIVLKGDYLIFKVNYLLNNLKDTAEFRQSYFGYYYAFVRYNGLKKVDTSYTDLSMKYWTRGDKYFVDPKSKLHESFGNIIY